MSLHFNKSSVINLWRHIKVVVSQIIAESTICLRDCSGYHQRSGSPVVPRTKGKWFENHFQVKMSLCNILTIYYMRYRNTTVLYKYSFRFTSSTVDIFYYFLCIVNRICILIVVGLNNCLCVIFVSKIRHIMYMLEYIFSLQRGYVRQML